MPDQPTPLDALIEELTSILENSTPTDTDDELRLSGIDRATSLACRHRAAWLARDAQDTADADAWLRNIDVEEGAEAKADAELIAKLPRYDDTGEAFVPGVDDFYIVGVGSDKFVNGEWNDGTMSVHQTKLAVWHLQGKWEPCYETFDGPISFDDWTGHFYKTKAAAEAAAREVAK
jgi:hypothetical protein